MKLSAVEYTRVPQYSAINNKKNRSDINYKQNNNINFTGASGVSSIASALVRFWQFVDNGGRGLQFFFEDMFGTNIERSAYGFAQNFYYGLQETIREALTGPSMVGLPVAILSIATKLSGKTVNTHKENIENLSDLMEKTLKNNPENYEDAFYNNAVKDLLENTIDDKNPTQVSEEEIAKITEGIKKYSKAGKKEKPKVLSSIQLDFENIIKKRKTNYKGTNGFQDAKYSLKNGKTGSTNFKNYIGYIEAYAYDFAKKCKKDGVTPDKIDIKAFKNNWVGKRILTAINMGLLTGIFMAQIPKLYTKASGKINPSAINIYNEADKKGGDK